MNAPAISVHNLSKRYKLGVIGRHTLVDEASYWWHRVRGRDPKSAMGQVGYSVTEARRVEAEGYGADEFWALKNVSFDAQQGEVIGVIGRNGAGKSTLLKILTRITEPTSGEATINGRVGSLLEVGTGFHPELTGRENIYMNGTILGMKKKEIDSKLEQIVEFSEISEFIDTPVKRYSSGMYVRLAFSVAAHLDPEILLIDEVLAVGDVGFQKKCLGKMNDVSSEGRTILFVSHNMAAIKSLCDRVILIDDGYNVMDGLPEAVTNEYLDRMSEMTQRGTGIVDLTNHPGRKKHFDRFVELTELKVLDSVGNPAEHINPLEETRIEISYKIIKEIGAGVNFDIAFSNTSGQRVCSFATALFRTAFSLPSRKGVVTCVIPSLPLAPGRYSLSSACKVGGVATDSIRDIIFVDVDECDFFGFGKAPSPELIGNVMLDHRWEARA